MIRSFLLTSLYLFVVITSPAHAFMLSGVTAGSVPAVGGSCNTLADSQQDEAGSTFPAIGQFSTDWVGAKVAVTSSYTACKIIVPLTVTGTPAFNITPCLYTDSAGDPDTELECDTAQAAPTVAGDFEYTVSQSVSSGDYHLVFKPSANNSSNYVSLTTEDDVFCSDCVQSSSDSGSSWGTFAHRQASYEIYQ